MKNDIVIIDKLERNEQFEVFDDESKTFVIFLADERDQIGDVRVMVKGKSAKVQILGVIIGFGKQKINLYSLQDHQKPGSISDLLIKSVLFGHAKFNYQGLIRIEKAAQKSNAYQKNQNLLMSEKAWANSRPYLEILANNVRCTHGVTIGKIDEEQLYYLKTRGLDDIAARKMLISGFLSEVIERIPDEKLQEKIRKKIDGQMVKLLALSSIEGLDG